jgi:hypothetical protein
MVFPRYEPLRRTWLCAMGHNGEFGCAMGHCGGFGSLLWVTETDLVMRSEPLCEMKPYSINLYYFCAMGHSAGNGYALWAMAQGLVFRHGP